MSKTGSLGEDRTIIYLKKDDERRHRTWCRYFNDGKCTLLLRKCTGSAQCDFYKKKEDLPKPPDDPKPPKPPVDDSLPGRPLEPFETLPGKRVLLIFKKSGKQYEGRIIGGDINRIRVHLDSGGTYDYSRKSNPDYIIRVITKEI